MKLSKIYELTKHKYNRYLTDKDRLINYIDAQSSQLEDMWEYCDITGNRIHARYLKQELEKLRKELETLK